MSRSRLSYRSAPLYYLTYILHWLAGCLGICAYMVVFAFMPGLLPMGDGEQVRTFLFGLPLSVGVLHAFPWMWKVGLLVVGSALFVWISFLFLMSTHNLIVGVVGATTRDRQDGERSAWVAMGSCLLVLAGLFAWIMFGTLLSFWALVYVLALCAGTGLLLRQNYGEFIDI